MKGFFVAAALAAASVPAAAHDQPSGAPAAEPAAERVAIPFAPPLGTELRYRHTVSNTKKGKPETKSHDIALRFERLGDGYRMVMKVTVPGLTPAQKRHPLIVIMERPISFRLAADGELLSIENDAEYWRGIARIFDEMASDPSRGPEAAELARSMLGQMLAMSERERAAMAAKNIYPVLEMAGVELSVGETRVIEGEESLIPFPDGNIPLRSDLHVTMLSATAVVAEIEVAEKFDPAEIKTLVERIRALAPPDRRSEEDPSLDLGQRNRFTVSRITGLARRSERKLVGGASATGEKIATTETLIQLP